MSNQEYEGAAQAEEPKAAVWAGPMRHVMVCLDRSESDERSLAEAVALTGTSAASITLLHVLEPSLEFGCASPTDPLAWEVGRREARGYLQRQGAGIEALGIKAQLKLVEGHAAERILAEMRASDVELTVLARDGRHGPGEWTLGSTVQKVLSCFPASILIVPTPSSAAFSWRTPPQRVLVPLDGSVRAECALALARTIADSRDAELILVHVVREPGAAPQPLLERDDTELLHELTERREHSGRHYLGRLLSAVRASGTRVRCLVERSGDVRLAILEIARRELVDLIVLSAHGVTCNAERSYGSVAEHLIHDCNRPLLLVQDLRSPPWSRVATGHAAPPVHRRSPALGHFR